MILTVTANAALDRVLFIDHFEPTSVMRAERMVDSVGGKGLDASVVLQVLGAPNIAVSFMAGNTGQALAAILDSYGIQHDLVWVHGDTRTANVLIEQDYHRLSHIMTVGYEVNEEEWREFLRKIEQHAPHADWVIMGGSLPKGCPDDLFGQVTHIAHQHGAKCLIDSPGKPMLAALPHKPDILKLNRSEFKATFGLEAAALKDLITPVRELMRVIGVDCVVITAGEDGILLVLPNTAYRAKAPQQVAVNAAGAGDSVSAALTHALTQQMSWEESLRLSAATSAAVVLTEGTADCRMEDIQRLYPLVSVECFNE
ncbi:hypothetical protein ADN00_13485 [Ornatilinea apprima]|uniref:Carbohydrate kinase PfkB domain-containing protein n=2 Tax=Ornatilinea apprima TaxID=1134406 RepID=A0A0P6XR75_9CHLR|nr:hypothetical protein ADN00_13485 [Ornatilinea apprima]